MTKGYLFLCFIILNQPIYHYFQLRGLCRCQCMKQGLAHAQLFPVLLEIKQWRLSLILMFSSVARISATIGFKLRNLSFYHFRIFLFLHLTASSKSIIWLFYACVKSWALILSAEGQNSEDWCLHLHFCVISDLFFR